MSTTKRASPASPQNPPEAPPTAKQEKAGAKVTPETLATFDADEAQRFANVVYRDVPGWFGLSWLVGESFRNQAFSTVEGALAHAAERDPSSSSIYLRTTTTRTAPKARGLAADSAYLPGLWADLDFGTAGHKHDPAKHSGLVLPPDADQAYAVIAASGLPAPTLLVHSGGGLYPWWLLDEPADLTDTLAEWTERSAAWQRQLAAGAERLGYYYGSGVGDLARVLRLPGSVNRKTAEERPCRVVSTDGLRYSDGALSQALEDAQLVVERRPGPAPTAKRSKEEKDELDFRDATDPGPFLVLAEQVGIRGVLLAAGWTECECAGRAGVQECFTRPGGGSTTNHSAHILKAEPHVLVVFSEEAGLPVGGGQRLTAGRVFAHLHHGGDMSAAARDVLAAMRGEGSEAARALGLPVELPTEQHRGHLRMALRMMRRTRDTLRYVHGLGWHVWDGTRWAQDRNGTAMREAVDTVKAAYADLAELSRDEEKALLADIHRCESAGGLEGVLKIAGSLLPLAVSVDQLDADVYLFNTANGTLDLRTGELRPHDPADLLTKVAGCGYDPAAESATFTKFLEEVLPDPEVRAFVRRVFGHALEGRVSEHLLPIFSGTGANGKSTLLEAVTAAFGDYAIAAEPDLLVDRGPVHTTGQADLLGVRLAVSSETDGGRRLAAATVKRLTGGDKIRARKMRKDNIEFAPSHSVIMVTNHRPQVSGDDPALWRRLRVVPFDVVVDKPDTSLGQRLALELPAVLAWVVRGHADWHDNGLADPPAVTAATSSYKDESDDLGRFLGEACTTSPRATVKSRPLFVAWQDWCHANGEEPGTEKAFAQAMTGRGFEKKKRQGVQTYLGLGLLDTDPPEGDFTEPVGDD